MKKFVIIAALLAVLAGLLLGLLLHALADSERRAKIIGNMNELKEAHLELQKYGVFTNQFRNETVYSYTNRFNVEGTNYQCEFAVECEWFTNRGFLTITTNEVFVWIDKKRGAIPLGTRATWPP